jgi:hypothetical protein
VILEFSSHRGEPVCRGPLERLRFESSRLLDDDTGRVVLAHQEDQLWILEGDGRRFARIECVCRVQVWFETREGRSRGLGPFREFSSLDGVTYVNGRILAFFDRQNDDWYSYDLGNHWKACVIERAPTS